mmetsp:Transcript_13518/g.20513  ORF Transcript_13518/g.20513 Transcript_13518/m.20513 type:complete len:542 (-) Transcript_13518:2531-4156(-)
MKKRYSSLDDGGADKDSGRLYRRKRKQVVNAVMIPVLLIVVIWFLIQVQHHVSDKLDKKRKRNKILMKAMRKKFQTNNDDHRGNAEGNVGNSGNSSNGGVKSKYRWVDLRVLPPLNNDHRWFKKFLHDDFETKKSDFKIEYHDERLEWESSAEEAGDKPPSVDYTKIEYRYPDPILHPPRDGEYPMLEPMETLFERWPQDDIDSPPLPFFEKLQHFDFKNRQHMDAAVRYRDLEFPFKVYNIPEIENAGQKWTDEYLSYHFDRYTGSVRGKMNAKDAKEKFGDMPPSSGKAQMSKDSFFAFFNGKNWNVDTLGEPPTMDTDLTYEKWAKHARYADAVGLASNEMHYYWQSGVPKHERDARESHWSMISHDLPSFGDPEPNFFSFNPKEAKGIQCRFGERGVTAATHYDGGRNMVGMITGAKRYILSPPNECPKLGIVNHRRHPSYRHSMLNFGHINLLKSTDEEVTDMPDLERQWLERSKDGMAIETVLKAGEVLYIPSHWFHYITSLQKSAQCNVRSGRHTDGSPEFGGEEEVTICGEED